MKRRFWKRPEIPLTAEQSELAGRSWEFARRLARRHGGDDDAATAALLRAIWEDDGRMKFLGRLSCCVRFECLHGRRPKAGPVLIPLHRAPEPADPRDYLAAAESAERARAILAGYPAGDRAILEAVAVDGLTLRQAAERTGVSISTAKKRFRSMRWRTTEGYRP